MTDVTCTATRTAIYPPIADNSCADAGTNLDEDEIIDINACAAAQFAQRHDIDIVIYHDTRCRKSSLEIVADAKTFPGWHQWRRDEHTVCKVDRARHADANPQHLFHLQTGLR